MAPKKGQRKPKGKQVALKVAMKHQAVALSSSDSEDEAGDFGTTGNA